MGYPNNLSALMRVRPQNPQPQQALPATGVAGANPVPNPGGVGGPQIQMRPPTAQVQPPNIAPQKDRTWNQRHQTQMGMGQLNNPNDPAYQAIQQGQNFNRAINTTGQPSLAQMMRLNPKFNQYR